MSTEPVWQNSPWESLPPLTEESAADVCVVGLGGSGLAALGELRRSGIDAVGIDARDVGAGAAGRNGGFLLAGTAMFYHLAVERLGRERARALYRMTMEEIDRMTAETPDAIRRVGSIRLAMSPEELEDCQRQHAAMRADDLPVEDYEGVEGRGLLFPFDGGFNPLLRCQLLAEELLNDGVRLHGSTPALELAGDRVVTPSGSIRCRAVIVAVDGNLEALPPELAGRVRTARLQMLATAPTDEVSVPRPVYARWGYEYWQQLPDRRIALGGFRDRFIEEEWTSSGDPTESVQQALESFLRERLGVHAPITHRWGAPVSYTASGLPIVEEVRPGLWAIGGYSGTGNVIGAICGRAVARRLAGGDAKEIELLAERTT